MNTTEIRSTFVIAAFAALVSLMTQGAATAQTGDHGTQTAAAEGMPRLAFLMGHWEGDGWIEVAPGERRPFHESETVAAKLQGSILVVEGLGHGVSDRAATSPIVHEALAVISWDAPRSEYRFLSWESSGRHVDAAGRLEQGAFLWSFAAGPGREIQFRIHLDDQGRWTETGESGGHVFFEMILTRQPA